MKITEVSTNGESWMGFDEETQEWVPIPAPPSAQGPTQRQVAEPPGLASRVMSSAPVQTAMGLGSNIAQGALLGWGDELSAALQTLPTALTGGGWTDPYRKNVERIRAGMRGFSEQNPLLSIGAQALGGMGTGMGVGAGVVKAASQAPAALRLVGAGMGEGAVAGAGEAETLAEVPALAGTGAVVGGALGVAAPIGGRILSGAGNLARAIGRAFTESPSGAAARRLSEVLSQAGITPEEFVRRANELGEDAVLADLSPTLQRELRGIVSLHPELSHEAVKVLGERQRGGLGRIVDEARGGLGLGRTTRLETAVDDLDTLRRQEARRDYAPVYEQTPPMDERLVNFLKRKPIQRAFQKAQDIAEYTGEKMPELFNVKSGGEVEVLDYPTVRVWDQIKQGLDEEVLQNTDPITGKITSYKGTAAIRAKNELLDLLDEHIPEYKAARSKYAGYSSLIDAHNRGANVFKEGAEGIEKAVSRMGESELEAYRLGVFNAIRDEAEAAKTMGTPAARVKFSTPKYTRRIRAAFPDDESFDRFMNRLERELTFTETYRFGTNVGQSPTGFIGGEQANLAENIGDEVASAVAGRGPLSIPAMAANLWNRAGYSQPVQALPAGQMFESLMGPIPSQMPRAYQSRPERYRYPDFMFIGGGLGGLGPLLGQ